MLLNTVLPHFKTPPNFYLFTTSKAIQELGPYSSMSPRVHLFNEKMSLNPGGSDFIIVMSPLDNERLKQLIDVLEVKGSIVIVALKDQIRIMRPGFINGIRDFLKNLFDEPLASKLSRSFTSMLIPTIATENSMTSLEIGDILKEKFVESRILGDGGGNPLNITNIHYGRGKRE